MRKEYDMSYVEENDSKAIIGFINNDKNSSFLENIMFIEFKVNVGDEINIGDEILIGESVKGVESLKAEISGKVIEINKAVQEDPEILKDKPEEWLFKIDVVK